MCEVSLKILKRVDIFSYLLMSWQWSMAIQAYNQHIPHYRARDKTPVRLIHCLSFLCIPLSSSWNATMCHPLAIAPENPQKRGGVCVCVCERVCVWGGGGLLNLHFFCEDYLKSNVWS